MKLATAFIAALIAGALFSVIACWPVMIALGIFHSYLRGVPALGFWASAVVTVAARMLIPMPSAKGSE